MINHDTIIKMAREAGLPIQIFQLERFAALVAALVAAAEREQCALAAWEIVQYEVHADLADQVAQVIRARNCA